MYAMGTPLLQKGRARSFQTSLHCSREGISLPSTPHILRIWDVPERKNHMLDSSPPTLCPDASTHRQLGTAYVSATTGAVATALGLKSLTKVNAPHLPYILLPFLHHSSKPTYRLPTSLPRVPHRSTALRATKCHLPSPSTCPLWSAGLCPLQLWQPPTASTSP